MIRAKSATYRHFTAKYLFENLKKVIHNQSYKILDLEVPLAKKIVGVRGCALVGRKE